MASDRVSFHHWKEVCFTKRIQFSCFPRYQKQSSCRCACSEGNVSTTMKNKGFSFFGLECINGQLKQCAHNHTCAHTQHMQACTQIHTHTHTHTHTQVAAWYAYQVTNCVTQQSLKNWGGGGRVLILSLLSFICIVHMYVTEDLNELTHYVWNASL